MTRTIEVGGQAVINGIMLRSSRYVVTAVRDRNKIIYRKDRLWKKPKFLEFFFIRGIVNLIEMLVIGVRSLNWSANQSVGKEEEISNMYIILTLFVAFIFAIFLFLFLPYLLTLLVGLSEERNPIFFNLFDGAVKIAILLLYIYLISFIGEIKDVFRYHGAEHKVVFCYEQGDKLDVRSASKYGTLHPRCGTAFLLIVVFLGIFLFSFIPLLLNYVYPEINSLPWFFRRIVFFVSRILFLPLIAGFSYEILKIGSKNRRSILRFLSYPGLLVQKLTTREPTSEQLDVAIFALKKLLELEEGHTKSF